MALAVIRAGVEVRGFEPLASSVRGKRSAGLSYTPGIIQSYLRGRSAFPCVDRLESNRSG